MALIDKIEMLGSAVDAGLIDRKEAPRLLVAYSDGRLTQAGAAGYLAQYRTLRRTRGFLADTETLIDALHTMKQATTPEEYLAAHEAMLAEVRRQQQRSRERVRKQLLDGLHRWRW